MWVTQKKEKVPSFLKRKLGRVQTQHLRSLGRTAEIEEKSERKKQIHQTLK